MNTNVNRRTRTKEAAEVTVALTQISLHDYDTFTGKLKTCDFFDMAGFTKSEYAIDDLFVHNMHGRKRTKLDNMAATNEFPC